MAIGRRVLRMKPSICVWEIVLFVVMMVCVIVIYDQVQKGNVAPWLKARMTKAEATTTIVKDYEIIDLGWREVLSESTATAGRGPHVFQFGVNPGVSVEDRGNIRFAVSDVAPRERWSDQPLITKNRKKIYVIEIRPNPMSLTNSPIYMVKLGNLDAERAKAGL